MIQETVPIWPITLFFLLLAVASLISSLYWNWKYNELNDKVQRALQNTKV